MVDYAEIVQGGDEAALRAFIAANSGSIFTGERTLVFIGQPPKEEPLHSLPVPPQTQVVGSVEHPQQQTQYLLVSQLTPTEIKAHYEEALANMGWQVSEGGYMRSGFLGAQVEVLQYCNQSTRQLLHGHIQADDDRTYIRLNLSKVLHPCGDPHGHLKRMAAIPNLSAPKGVYLVPSSFSSGSTGGMDHFEVRTGAVARWAGSLNDLYQAYLPLLQSAGWQMDTESITDKVAVSWWDLTLDEESWQGVFSVLARPKTPDHFALTLTMSMSVA